MKNSKFLEEHLDFTKFASIDSNWYLLSHEKSNSIQESIVNK